MATPSAPVATEIPQKRVAVVGSGLAGLSVAYLLASNGFVVHIYEKGPRLGLAAASIIVRVPAENAGQDRNGHIGEEDLIMDVPMRSFFPEHYSYLTALYKHLHIPYHTSDNSISFSEYRSADLFGVDGRSPWRALKTVAGYLKFLAIVQYLSLTGKIRSELEGLTLDDFWVRYGISREYVEGAFIPLFCGVCTCESDTLGQFPAVTILEYVSRAMPFGRMSFVTPGVESVCEALTQPVQQVYLRTAVAGIYQSSSSPSLEKQNRFPTPPPDDTLTTTGTGKVTVETTEGIRRRYDHVVFATQANQAARILKGTAGVPLDGDAKITADQIRLLERFQYAKSIVTCHTDASLMPQNESMWRCMNFFTHTGIDDATSTDADSTSTDNSADFQFPYATHKTPTCTHYFNMSHNTRKPIKGTDYFQTTNPYRMPAPDKTIATTWFERAVVTLDSAKAVDDLSALQGLGRRWFVGSWAWEGIPLLEGCVASAVEVAKGIAEQEGVDGFYVPWNVPADSVGKQGLFSGYWILWTLLAVACAAYLASVII
ncbi:uncharacterized protein EV422DRAFT_613840 [Fimicolochytrium jonesii]|uniref:uncharacterized protein n=1 Tax=Fimicolochytrium jonesii TaxID=1396493 RepID=UPI0022FDE26A|nr:uncharacterized protein EV422DRAFT_613840 [Fimicolochytrium jonesii]KAI8822572.1 hypothetical protein EV422DRAFT_613840 [Fimicolochytrium jonesii]